MHGVNGVRSETETFRCCCQEACLYISERGRRFIEIHDLKDIPQLCPESTAFSIQTIRHCWEVSYSEDIMYTSEPPRSLTSSSPFLIHLLDFNIE